MKKNIFIIIWLAGLWLTAAKFPPHLQWREISRGAFTIIFPADRWQQAEAALARAESAYEKLAAFWHDRPAGRIRIVLDDSTDQANGFATFFPFNLVGINLSEPPPDSELACSRNWLDLVLAHELTHIFTLNAAAEPFYQARRVFGNLPILFPAVQLPAWVIEGLAVDGESRFTADGRLNHAPYPLMLAATRRNSLFPEWSQVSGLPVAWPGPSAKYLFGAGFMHYLSEKYGADSLRQYLERSTSRLILFSSSRDFEKTFGQSLGKLWGKFRSNRPEANSHTETGLVREPLVDQGFSNQYPCPLSENRLVYYHRNYQGRGAVEMLDIKSGRKKILCKLDAVNSINFTDKENKIFLSASEYFHAFSDFSDLYEFDIGKRRLKRLSRGQRLSQPIKKENSNEIYCVQRLDGYFFLALFDIRKQKVNTLSRAFIGLSQLSLSPDRSLIAAAVKPENKPWGIGIFSTAGELQTFVTANGADCRQPCWQSNRMLYFIQAGVKTTSLASLSIAGNNGAVCSDPQLNGLQQFSLDSDGKNICFNYYSGSGLDIARLEQAGLQFHPQELIVLTTVPEIKTIASKTVSRPYRFWRDLLPHYWSTSWRMGGDEFQGGIATGGQDALEIHSFSLEGYYGFSSHRGNFFFTYTYDGLFPTLSFSYNDSIEYYRNHDDSLRSQEIKLASLWPLRIRKHSQLFAYIDLHLERHTVIDDWGIYKNHGSYNGLRLGIDLNYSREYYDSVSPTDGIHAIVQGSINPAGLGNAWTSRNIQTDLRHYISLLRPGVLAWRLALARSWDTGYNTYNMGGCEIRNSLGNDHPFRLLRGFCSNSFIGDRGWQFNLEYRLPLFKIEKAILPAVSLDRVYLNTFCDMGRLSNDYYSHPTAYSVGGEMVLRLAFGGAAFNDLSFGTAYGFGPKRSWCIYLRTGRSF